LSISFPPHGINWQRGKPLEEPNPDPHVDCFQTWGPVTNIIIERNFCKWTSVCESTDQEVSSLESIDGTSSQITYENNVFVNMRQGIKSR
jgi:hypothetical protein